MSATITFPVGEKGHTAVTTNTNLDGSLATDVVTTYASDNEAAVLVDANTGELDGVGEGTANITETSTRGVFTHSDTGVVIVEAADFTTVLTFT